MVADVIEDWINVGNANAMSCLYMLSPGSFEDNVELLVPVLLERGIIWNDYAIPEGTMRENLRREPGTKTLPSNHRSAQFRYDILKTKYADERGDIVIDRTKEGKVKGNHLNGVIGYAPLGDTKVRG